MALERLAADIGPGGTGFLVVVVLIVAAIAIFIAMAGSLKRLRQSVARGAFGQPGEPSDTAPPGEASPASRTEVKPDHAVTRDPGGPGGAGA